MNGCECPTDLPCECAHAPERDAWTHTGVPALLKEAAAVILDREHSYGAAEQHHAATAQAWTALLRHKLPPGVELDANDVQRLFIADKLVRDTQTPIDDNPLDIVGYAVCLARCRAG